MTCALRELPGTQSSGLECCRQRKQDLCGPGVRNELEVTEKPKASVTGGKWAGSEVSSG